MGRKGVTLRVIRATHFLALADKDHPIFDGEITAERFAAYEHINISRRGVNAGPIDAKLMDLGLSRTIAMVAPTFVVGMFALPGSKLIMPAPEHMVWGLAALDSRIRAFRIPLTLDHFTLRQAWHPRLDNDAVHRWLRSTVFEVCKLQPSGFAL
jgi:DNA-binding transcriptional LysR family regulator